LLKITQIGLYPQDCSAEGEKLQEKRHLARIIHACFYYNRRDAAATSLAANSKAKDLSAAR